MKSSSAPRSSGSATLTSPTPPNNTNTRDLEIEIVLIVLLVVLFLVSVPVLAAVWCLCRKKRNRPGRYHQDAPHDRQDDFNGRTPQYTDVNTFTCWGKSDVNINPNTQSNYAGNAPERPPPLLPGSVPRPPTTQAVPESGVDLSSGLQGSQQPIPPPPPVSVPLPPTSQAVLDNADDISSGFGASQRPLPPPHQPPPGRSFGCSKKFSYVELEAATDSFSPTNLLGEGGFAHVCKGTLLGGKNIAVKRLKVRGREEEPDFQAEVKIISRVHHRPLVSFLLELITNCSQKAADSTGKGNFDGVGKAEPAKV